MLCTDLVARGLDIPAVKAVLNFSFPVEPKRYLHRIGRTARAGSHGVAVTLCNDEERKDIKKLLRKLSQNINTYVMSAKQVTETHDFIANKLDPIIHELDTEIQADKEIEAAYKEAVRAENLVKFKKDIMSRPKAEWHTTKKQATELKKESKKDLKNIRNNFEVQLASQPRKRDVKKAQKEQAKSGSKFRDDAETDKAAKHKKKSQDIRAGKDEAKSGKTREQHERERKKFRGKRNSPGAKMAGFKGGLPHGKKPKFVAKNAEHKGGVPGAKKQRLDAEKRKRLEKIVGKKE